MKTENFSRRRFISTGMLAAAGMALASKTSFASSIFADKPNSLINGVQIGVITYSFRSMPGSVEQLLQYSNALGKKNTDAEINYAFNAGKALGCTHVTVELPEDDELTQRLGDKAAEHKIYVGYHAHTQATPTLWDTALRQSDYNAINLDIGHYVAGTSSSPIDFILKNSDRIVSMHIKDRKFKNGPNAPWGEGDTPIKEVLALMKKKKYKFPATIELEYNIPAGSDAVKEVIKCREYAKNALA